MATRNKAFLDALKTKTYLFSKIFGRQFNNYYQSISCYDAVSIGVSWRFQNLHRSTKST